MKWLSAVLLLGMTVAAWADDEPTPPPPPIQMVLTPQDLAFWVQLGPTLDQCVGGAQLSGDLSSCKALRTFLTEFNKRVQAVKPPPEVK
jgi:hypothetical protein